jgi:hypothetical protein
MDEVIRFMQAQGGQGDQLGIWEVVFALSLSFVCLLFVCFVYRFTHKSPNYSQSFVQTLVLTGMVTSLIMIVIGSNIARAFSLVGALSIIRFRNAVKETRDVGYIFFAMAIAMACGTRFYGVAVLATFLINAILILMYLSDFGTNRLRPERVLTVRLPPGVDPESALGSTLTKLFDAFSIISLETVRQGMFVDAVFSVRPKPNVTGGQVIESISRVNDNLKVTYNYNTHTDDL